MKPHTSMCITTYHPKTVAAMLAVSGETVIEVARRLMAATWRARLWYKVSSLPWHCLPKLHRLWSKRESLGVCA
jgi:hypothetical protein